MRRLVPSETAMDVTDAYAGLVLPEPPPGADRAHVALGMVASADGAVTVAGRSGGLGGDADRVAFRRLRDACDAILVGAGTVRVEDYGPPPAPPERAAARRAQGLTAAPRLLVITGRGDLDPAARLFTLERDPEVPRPVVVTSGSAPAARLAALEDVAEVVRFGQDEVDLTALLRWCRAEGLDRVLCEGGPSLCGSLLAAGLVDEVFLTVAPVLVSGDAGRIVAGATLPTPVPLALTELHEHDGELLLRYQVVGHGRPAA